MRCDLKEAVGKALARRTGIAYEAAAWGEKANIFEARYSHGTGGCRCGGHKCEGRASYPERSEDLLEPIRLSAPKGVGMGLRSQQRLRGWSAYFKLATATRPLLHPRAVLDAAGAVRRACLALCGQWSGSLVECGCVPHEPGPAKAPLRSDRTGVGARYGAQASAFTMNRRIRIRTYGGMGGRQG